ncbi:MAG: hypothetical protein V4654_09930 [Bdellovibrionota bacterium]
MKKLITLICVALLTGANVYAEAPQAQDQCSYDFPNAKSALDTKSKDFLSFKKPVRNNKEKVLTQKAVLKKDKVKITFTTGGCAHYSYSFTFANLKEKDFMSNVAFSRAIELLKATPTTTEGQALTKTLSEALESSAMNKIFRPPNSVYEIPCGDAQCSLDASVKGQLTTTYSFAL